MKSDLKVIPKGLYDEGAANGDDPHLTNGKWLYLTAILMEQCDEDVV